MVGTETPPAQAAALNLSVLDGWASDCFSRAEQLRRSPLHRLRTLLEKGDINAALSLVAEQKKLSEVAQDPRLMFRLHKQKFIELLRKGISSSESIQGVSEALACARTQLAPMALDAYPEAYTEFKQVLQLLVYAGNMQCASPQASTTADWQAVLSEAARQELAEVLYQTVSEAAGYQESKLALLLLYLLRLHSMHRHLLPSNRQQQRQQAAGGSSQADKPPKGPRSSDGVGAATLEAAADTGGGAAANRLNGSSSSNTSSRGGGGGGSSPGRGVRRSREHETQAAGTSSTCGVSLSELCDQLLLPGCDAPPLRDDLHAVGSFNESDIQALMQCAGSSRRDAIAALRHHRNKLWPAFQSELQRLRLNWPLLSELVAEYCADRGIPCSCSSGDGESSEGCHEDGMDADVVPCDKQHGAGGAAKDGASAGGSNDGVGLGEAEGGGAGQAAGRLGSQDMEADVLSGPRGLARLTVRRSASRSPPAKMHCSRQPGQQDRLASSSDGQEQPQPPSGPALLARLRAVAEGEGLEAFQAAVSQAAPGFWEQHPTRHMQLWAAAFSTRLGAGDVQGALGLARAHMAPLAAQHTQLQPQLKAAMAALIPAPPAPSSAAASHELDQSAAGGKGDSSNGAIPAPQEHEEEASRVVADIISLLSSTHLGGGHNTRLVKLLQELLALYKAWLRAERVSDPFQVDLGIPALRTNPNSKGSTSATGHTGHTIHSDGHTRLGRDGARATGAGTAAGGGGVPASRGLNSARLEDSREDHHGVDQVWPFEPPAGWYPPSPPSESPQHYPQAPNHLPYYSGYMAPSPAYAPHSPAYSPGSPAYAPIAPGHAPNAEGEYYPRSPAYYPRSPAYSPDQGDGMMSSEEEGGEGEEGRWGAAGAAGGGGALQGPSEQDIARLIEILALPRSQAVALLSEYGDVEAAVNSAFG